MYSLNLDELSSSMYCIQNDSSLNLIDDVYPLDYGQFADSNAVQVNFSVSASFENGSLGADQNQFSSILTPPSSIHGSCSSPEFDYPASVSQPAHTQHYIGFSSELYQENGPPPNYMSGMQESYPPGVIVKPCASIESSVNHSDILDCNRDCSPLLSAHSTFSAFSSDFDQTPLFETDFGSLLDDIDQDIQSFCTITASKYEESISTHTSNVNYSSQPGGLVVKDSGQENSSIDHFPTNLLACGSSSHDQIDETIKISTPNLIADHIVEEDTAENSVQMVLVNNTSHSNSEENVASSNLSLLNSKTSDTTQSNSVDKSSLDTDNNTSGEKCIWSQSVSKLPKISLHNPVQHLPNNVNEAKGKKRSLIKPQLLEAKKVKLAELPFWSLKSSTSKRYNHTKAGRIESKSKCKAYELGPLPDPKLERHRRNAINAKRNRDTKKEQMSRLQDELLEVKQNAELIMKERDLLAAKLQKLESKIYPDDQAKLMLENFHLVEKNEQLQLQIELLKRKCLKQR